MGKRRVNTKKDISVEDLIEHLERLSHQDRMEFFKKVGFSDLVKYLSGEIRIYDWEGDDRKWPRATIRYDDGTEESVDIIRSVRENAASIGHPLILHAIRRWETIIIHHRALPRGNWYKTSEINFYKVARSHLHNLGNAIIEGAKNRAMPAEDALNIRRVIEPNDYIYLEMTWEILANDDVKYKRLGEGVKMERSPIDKLRSVTRKLRPAIINSFYNRRPLPWLYTEGLLFPLVVDGKTKDANLSRDVRLITSSGLEIDTSLDSRLEYHSTKLSEYKLWLKPPEGPITWVKVSDLKQISGSKIKIEHNTFRIGDIIEASGYGLAEQKPISDGIERAAITELLHSHRDIIENVIKVKLDLISKFLQSEKGRKFLKVRPSLTVFLSTFDSWRLGYSTATLRKFRSLAKKNEGMRRKLKDKDHLETNWRVFGTFEREHQLVLPDSDNKYVAKEIPDWLSLPTVLARMSK